MKAYEIALKKSLIGVNPKHLRTVEALGLKKINQSVTKPFNPQIKGMIEKIRYLLEVKER